MADASIEFGVTFTQLKGDEATSINTYEDWGCWLTASPAYSSKQPKYHIVSVPYRNDVIDFSRIFNNKVFFEESTVTYTLTCYKPSYSDAGRAASMRSIQTKIEKYLWDFNGSVSDDYRGDVLKNARCTSIEVTPLIQSGAITLKITLQGESA